jgi:tRNA U34 2-thiouridine synthase MnmA/TrmU
MKAITLISGGLDSTLAAKLVNEQGIEVIGLRFKIPFCSNVSRSFSDLGIEIREVNIDDDFLKMMENPRYGYGSHMNPCIDCKILMLRKAKELMDECGAQFIITGEVLGQRPMSQHKQALATIAKKAGLEGLVLRPLSAKLLPETIPEKEGWIKREKLLSFSGRGRKQQIELAKTFGIKEYTQPAGGCLLTDPEFSKRLRDLITHEGLSLNNIELLKIGRHFRLSEKAKLVVGRNEKENKQLVNLAVENDYLFMPLHIAGPTVLGRGIFNDELFKLSCSITCRYCDLNGKINAEIIYMKIPEREQKILNISPIKENQLLTLRI